MTAESLPQPATAAGRDLLSQYRTWFAKQGWEAEGWDAEASAASLALGILAIEAEAGLATEPPRPSGLRESELSLRAWDALNPPPVSDLRAALDVLDVAFDNYDRDKTDDLGAMAVVGAARMVRRALAAPPATGSQPPWYLREIEQLTNNRHRRHPMGAEKIALGWTRDEVVDRFARIIRNKMGPDFWEAPPPEWATEAAETIWQNVEAMVRDRLETDRAEIALLRQGSRPPANEIDVDRLREAARRAELPREVTVADIERLAAEYDRG